MFWHCLYFVFMCTLTLKFSWRVASSDWANVCNQGKPFSTNVYQRMLLKRGTGLALQLCPPLQFGPLTNQPIEYVFISSNQSALWSCLRHLTSQVGEGCTVSFVRFLLQIRWKTKTVLERFPRWVFGEFYRSPSAKYVRNFSRATHMFICWRATKRGTGMKV